MTENVDFFLTKTNRKLTALPRAVMKVMLAENKPILIDDIADAVSISNRDVSRVLRHLRKHGFVQRHSQITCGSTRKSFYEVVPIDEVEQDEIIQHETIKYDQENSRDLEGGGVEVKTGPQSRVILLSNHRRTKSDTIGCKAEYGSGGVTSLECNFSFPSNR